MQKFTCPSCNSKLPFKWALTLSKDATYCCRACKTEVSPKHVNNATPFFIAGFILVVCAVKLSLVYKDDILLALLFGSLIGAVAIGAVILYLYITTDFESDITT